MTQQTEILLKRLSNLDSNLVSDVMDVGGLANQVLSPAIIALDQNCQLVGEAVCARGLVLTQSHYPKDTRSMFDIDAALFAGSVVVIENGGPPTCAIVGGLLARSWRDLGSVGVLTDGLVRDSGEIMGLGYPVFCCGTSPAFPKGRWTLVNVGSRVTMPGLDNKTSVSVSDGDLIIGDRDGVSVIPRVHAEAVIIAAEKMKIIEERIVSMMVDGKTRQEAFRVNPRLDHIPKFTL